MQETPNRSPYEPPEAPLSDPTLGSSDFASEITWGRTVAIWWSLGWRMALFGGGSAILSISILSVLIDLGPAAVVGLCLAIVINIRVTRYVFDKDFENFHLRLIPEDQSVASRRATSIWWCFQWRSWAAMLLLSLLGSALEPLIGSADQYLVNLVVQTVGLPINVVVFRTVLRKRYRRFVIEIAPHRWAGDKRRVGPT